MAAGPLAGVRVLELSQIFAGPFCGVNLADLGADVVKLEPPEGEGLRSIGAFAPGESKLFHALNRGKRSLVINLRDERSQDLVHRLIPGYDVFTINARPSVPPRLRVDYETLRSFRPDLIYVENTGYGSRGPSADRAGSDIIAQAYSGLLAGDGKVDERGAPLPITATAPADYTAGLAGAMGVCAALYQRARTGEGQYIGSSLLAAALALQSSWVSRVPVVDALIRDPMLERLAERRREGASYRELLETRGHPWQQLGAAFRLYYGGFDVQDGAVILGALTEANRDQIRGVLGIDDDPTADPEFNALDPQAETVAAEVRERIAAILRTRTMDEWISAFDAVGAPASKVSIPEEMSDDEQVEALGLMLELEHELTGPERIVGPIVELPGSDAGSMRASPPLDRHTDEVLQEGGLLEREIAELREAGVVGAAAAR